MAEYPDKDRGPFTLEVHMTPKEADIVVARHTSDGEFRVGVTLTPSAMTSIATDALKLYSTPGPACELEFEFTDGEGNSLLVDGLRVGVCVEGVLTHWVTLPEDVAKALYIALGVLCTG